MLLRACVSVCGARKGRVVMCGGGGGVSVFACVLSLTEWCVLALCKRSVGIRACRRQRRKGCNSGILVLCSVKLVSYNCILYSKWVSGRLGPVLRQQST